MRVRADSKSWTRADKAAMLGVWVMIGAFAVGGFLSSGYRAYRFAHFAEVADAVIVGSDVGCFGALGGGTSMGGKSSITYTVEFPYAGRTHRTRVLRPCSIYPPDFGRGRGKIWVQYDREDPDRIRVLNDDRERVHARNLGYAVVAYVSVIAGVIGVRRKPVTNDRESG